MHDDTLPNMDGMHFSTTRRTSDMARLYADRPPLNLLENAMVDTYQGWPHYEISILDLLVEWRAMDSRWFTAGSHADFRENTADRGDPYISKEATTTEPLDNFKGVTIAVDASHYLQQLLEGSPEPLLPALGGLPLAFESHINSVLDQWKAHDMTPLFIFDGQSVVGQENTALKTAKAAVERAQAAWALYADNQASAAVSSFGSSGTIQAKTFYRYFQRILRSRGLEFQTAAHSAGAHIAYLDRLERYQDGVMGSHELLLYDVQNCIITKIDFDKKLVHGVSKTDILTKLKVDEDTFIDIMLMIGTSFLPTFPVLMDSTVIKQQPASIKDAVNCLRTTGDKSVGILCQTWNDTLQKSEPSWEDKYRKAKMSVLHAIYVTDEGEIKIRNSETLTRDNHDYIGLRLPEEMYHYLMKGAIGPRVMNWLAYLEILVQPPLDGGESQEYRRLVTEQLVPIKEQTIALYASRIHRVFLFKKISMHFWFDDSTIVKMNHQNFQPSPSRQVQTWRVNKDSYKEQESIVKAAPGSLAFALLSLQDEKFAASTLPKTPLRVEDGKEVTKIELPLLRSKEEILTNTLWRFLHLRGYVNDKHELTSWGSALAVAIKALGAAQAQLDEAVVLAFELLRYRQLNAENPHAEWIGGPLRGSPQDQAFCLLIARCACLVKLRHKEIGYTGPLSKNLLSYYSIISAVRESDRDLTECVLGSMFLYYHADRKQTDGQEQDFEELGLSLPFMSDVDVGLGIAVKTYLDDHCTPGSSRAEKTAAKEKYARELIPHSVNFSEDLDIAFQFFDAVYTGIKAIGDAVPDQEIWKGASEYLAERR